MDRYRIEAPLGEGTMAQVYRAMDLSLDRPVALKILKTSADRRPQVRQRFLREAKASARLSHPNIVRVYDAGELEGRLYLALEFVPGPTLEQVFVEDPPGTRKFIEWMERIARGIHHAHEQGVVHRDLKPANIIISESGEPKVADFGLAHLVESETAMTQSGTALGTPLFMSPEQVAGHTKEISPRTDVYALGAILYLGLTGKTPHQAKTVGELYGKILNDLPREPRRLKPGISADLETICLKALAKEPSRRFETAEALADDLKCHLAGQAIRTKPLSAWGRLVQKGRRNRVLTTAIASLLIAALGMGTLVVVQRAKSEGRTGSLQRLASVWATITERNRDLRQLKTSPEQARTDLEKAVSEMAGYIKDWPTEPQGFYVRARGRLFLGDLEGATRDLETALARHPDFRPGWSLLGIVKVEEYQQLLLGDGSEYKERLAANRAVLTTAVDSFARGWASGTEREESRRWGLPWTREDQVMERLARAFKLYYYDEKGEEAVQVLLEGTKQYHAEEFALFIGMWSSNRRTSLDWLNQAIAWGPGYATAYLDRGAVRIRMGDAAGGLADYDRAIELRKDFAEAYFNRAMHKHFQGDLAGCLSDLDRTLEYRRAFPEAYCYRAAVLQTLGDESAARADYDRAIDLRKDYANALLNRAILKERHGDLTGAFIDAERVIGFRKDNAEAYHTRGLLKAKQGDRAGARSDYDKAIELKKDLAQAWCARGMLRADLKDHSGAVEDFGRAIDIKQDYEVAYRMRGHSRKILGDFPGAIVDYDRSIQLKVDRAQMYFIRGNVKVSLGNFAGAIADFDRAIDLQADYPDAYANRGSAKASMGQYSIAIADFDRAIGLRKDYGDAYLNRGSAKAGLKDYAGAVADYSRAIELKNDHAEAFVYRGSARAEQGDLSGAVADFDRAVQIKGDYAEAYGGRAAARQIQGNVPGAIADFQKALDVAPANWPYRTIVEERLRQLVGTKP